MAQHPRVSAGTVGAALWIPLAIKAMRNALEEGGNDFTILYRAGAHVLAGEPVYDGYYVYPPAFAVGMALVALLPYTVAALLWTLSKVALAVYSARVFTRGLPSTWSLFWVVVGPALLYRSFESDLVTGNSNVFLLFGIALAADLASRTTRWRGSGPGIVLGLVASVKLAPAYLLAAALSARRFATAALGCVTLVAAIVIASFVVDDGAEGSRSGFFGTSTTVFEADEVDLESGRTGYLPGQSLRALIHRLTRPIDATSHDRGKFVAIHWVDVGSADRAESIYRVIAALCGLAGLAIIARRRADLSWAIAFGACILLWISPYSRKAHFVLLLPAILMTIRSLHLHTSRRSRATIAFLIVALLLGPLTSKGLWGREIGAWLVAHCPFGLSSILVAIAFVRAVPARDSETHGG